MRKLAHSGEDSEVYFSGLVATVRARASIKRTASRIIGVASNAA
jgi:osmotically-inducible protein OsmY